MFAPEEPMGLPRSRIWPLSGAISPLMRESSVVFPQPEGPTTAMNSPGATEREMSERAAVSPFSE